MSRMFDSYLRPVFTAESTPGLLYGWMDGLILHQQKLSLRNEEGILRIDSFWTGLRRVTVLSLESAVAWTLLTVALAVEMVLGVIFVIFRDGLGDKSFNEWGNIFYDQHRWAIVGGGAAGIHFSLGEIAALYRYATEPKEEERA